MEKLPEKKRSLFDLNMLGIVIIMLPVSYTHLDVYKRQLLTS